MNRSKLFPALVISFFLALSVQVESKVCPNSLFIEGKMDFKTLAPTVYQECINEFEKTYGDVWAFFDNVTTSQIEASEYLQRVFAATYVLNPKE